MSDVKPEKEEADDRFAASTELTATLLKSAQELAEKHKAWASDLADKENAIRAEDEQLKKTTMEEFEAMKASLLAELEVAKKDLAMEKAAWEAECESVSRTQKFEPRIKLNNLTHEFVEMSWVDGSPVFPEDNKKLQHVTRVEPPKP